MGFTLESVIHIGYELAITTTINVGGLFFVPRGTQNSLKAQIKFLASQVGKGFGLLVLWKSVAVQNFQKVDCKLNLIYSENMHRNPFSIQFLSSV